MRVRWLGHSTFLLNEGSREVAIDPYGQFPEDRPIRFGYPPLEGLNADLVLISHEHLDHNGADVVGGDPQVIRSSPGTFDSPIGEVVGIASEHDPHAGTQRGGNTIFRFTLGGVRCCHFGDFGQSELRSEQREAIGDVDVLLIPVGGGPTIDGEQAAEIVAQLNPRIVVPMHYATPAADFIEGPERFLAAVSATVERPGGSELDARELIDSRDGCAVVVLEPAVLA